MNLQQPFAVVQPGQQITRHMRTPNFPIAGSAAPWAIMPTLIHPVLPGETMEEFRKIHRVISMPLANPLQGAWLENFLFYVKFTDLDRDLGEMFITPDFPTAGYTAAANRAFHYTKAGQIDWVHLCTKRCVEAFFVNEGETPRTHPMSATDTIYQAKVKHASWYQNLTFYSETDDPAAGASAGEISDQIAAWEMAQMMAMTEMTYEKYLEQYGVQSIKTAQGDPEILGFSRAWTLPTNTVEPTTGVPSSAWVWSQDVHYKKPKRFTEPGFVLELMVVRPKVYHNLAYSMVGNLWGFKDWFPAYNLKDPTAGVRKIQATDPVFTGISVGTGSADMIYDHKDLLSHGEQFVVSSSQHPYPPVIMTTIPSLQAGTDQNLLRGEYVILNDEDDIQPLFRGTTAARDRRYYWDGMASLKIRGHITDTTR